nr:reverse transcriptase domain-containing protein [Tanacetum cinerariifolium]
MTNTTLIVTTVTKPVTNPKDTDATPRVNIQYFCDEYYEDILSIIIDKVHRDKRKEVHARLDFVEGSRERRTREGRAHSTDLVKLTRQAQPSPDQTGQAPGIVLVVEAALIGGTRLVEIVLREGTTSVALGSHMITPTPSTGRGSTMDIAIATETAPAIRRGEGIVNPHYPACQKANLVMEGTESQRVARVWFDELLPESIDGYKDLKAAFLAYFMQQKKYVKDTVEIHNIKQKDGETIKDFMERFNVETVRMKGAPECMWISGFVDGVNNLKLAKRLNEHVPKIVEEMMITTIAFI